MITDLFGTGTSGLGAEEFLEVVKFTLELEVTVVKVEGSTTVSSPAPPTQKTGGHEGIL